MQTAGLHPLVPTLATAKVHLGSEPRLQLYKPLVRKRFRILQCRIMARVLATSVTSLRCGACCLSLSLCDHLRGIS